MADEPQKSWAEVLYLDPRRETGGTAKTVEFPLPAALRQVAARDLQRRLIVPVVAGGALTVFVATFVIDIIARRLGVGLLITFLVLMLAMPAVLVWWIRGMWVDLRRGVYDRSDGNIHIHASDIAASNAWLSVSEIRFNSVPVAAVTAVRQHAISYGSVDYLKRSQEVLAIWDGDGVLRYQIARYQAALA